MSIVWRSDALPPQDRFPAWRDITARSHVPTEVRSEHEADFHAAVRVVSLGPAQVSELSYPSLTASRSAKQVHQCDPELYLLTLSLRGRMGIEQDGREGTISPEGMVLYHTSAPFRGWVGTGHEHCQVIQVQAPRDLVPLPDREIFKAVATTIPAGAGVGALLAQFLAGVPRNTENCHPETAAKMGGFVADLMAVMVNEHIGGNARVVGDSWHRTLLPAVQAYIERHLADHDLSPVRVAAVHHVSVRSLQRVFRTHGTSVTDWIRRRRLERCRRDLLDPQLANRPIHTIAANWQFSSAAHFTRLFRATYGLTPREYQRHNVANRQNVVANGQPVLDDRQ
jgi:AraC-like DNA-binding protein